MTAQPTSEPTPKSRVQQKCPCGICGRDVAVNSDGTFRAHGPQEWRCETSGVKVRPTVYPVRGGHSVIIYGTCGVCGIVADHEVGNPKNFMKSHNHNRPRVHGEGNAYVVFWFRYRTFQWRRRYFPLHEMAMEFATTIKESTW